MIRTVKYLVDKTSYQWSGYENVKANMEELGFLIKESDFYKGFKSYFIATYDEDYKEIKLSKQYWGKSKEMKTQIESEKEETLLGLCAFYYLTSDKEKGFVYGANCEQEAQYQETINKFKDEIRKTSKNKGSKKKEASRKVLQKTN